MNYTNNHKYIKKYKGKNGKLVYSYVADSDSKKTAKANIAYTGKERTKNKALPYKDVKLTIDKNGNKTYERTSYDDGIFSDYKITSHEVIPEGERKTTYITKHKSTKYRIKGKNFIDKLFGR